MLMDSEDWSVSPLRSVFAVDSPVITPFAIVTSAAASVTVFSGEPPSVSLTCTALLYPEPAVSMVNTTASRTLSVIAITDSV